VRGPKGGREPERRVDEGTPRGLTPLQELQWVERFRRGDAEAARLLLEAYQRRIYGVCRRMLHDADAAADLTQDAMVKLLQGLAGYDGRSQLSTWIIRVTMNCCLSHLRRQKLRRHRSLNTAAAGDAASAPPNVDRPAAAAGAEPSGPQGVLHAERQQAVVHALADLDPDTRALLVLRDVQGLEYQQVADVLGIPLGTVKSRLFRAREALRQALLQRGWTEEAVEE
jgi:RNA polymerase sigma-70 factor, ECF subfamily